MVTKYQERFRIQCRHQYFGDGFCRALELRPTAQSARLLQRHGGLFQKTVAGGAVHYDARQPFAEAAPLTFALTGPKTQLAHTTDIAPESTVYYFHNLTDNGKETIEGEEFSLLHFVATPWTALPVHPPRFVYTFPLPVKAAKLQIVDVRNTEVWKTQTPPQELLTISLDLTALREGRYQLKTNGADPYDFYLTSVPLQAVWGLIDIFPGTPETRFAISLPPRQSVWRYCVVSQSPADRTYDGYRIAGGPSKGVKPNGTVPIAFNGPTRGRLNGREAWIFESNTLIPLYEYPSDHYEFTLQKNGKDNGPALPYARAETTRLERAPHGELRYCSEIYVYL